MKLLGENIGKMLLDMSLSNNFGYDLKHNNNSEIHR